MSLQFATVGKRKDVSRWSGAPKVTADDPACVDTDFFEVTHIQSVVLQWIQSTARFHSGLVGLESTTPVELVCTWYSLEPVGILWWASPMEVSATCHCDSISMPNVGVVGH